MKRRLTTRRPPARPSGTGLRPVAGLLHPSSLIPHPSSFRLPPCFTPSAFSLIEMLTAVAILVIVLGLMVSLARDVRNRSAERVTKDMLARLERLMTQYATRSPARLLPTITPLIRGSGGAEGVALAPIEDASFHAAAMRNNGDFAAALRAQAAADDPAPSFFDAWGNPIAFMPRQHPAIGMAGGDRFFFFSPGPDGQFLTREDNLYSYEVLGE